MSDKQIDVLEMIARSAPLEPTLSVIVSLVEDAWPGAVAAIMLMEDDNTLRVGAGPKLPLGFVDGIGGLPVGPNAASCGTAVFRRESVFTGNVADDDAWARYRELALSHGFRACWSAPIAISTDRIVGTLALYHHAPRVPAAADREFANDARLLAAIAIESHLNAEAVRMHIGSVHQSLDLIQSALERIRLIVGDNWPVERERTVIAREVLHVARLADDLRGDSPAANTHQQLRFDIDADADA
jgi:GAF domain-containing protein